MNVLLTTLFAATSSAAEQRLIDELVAGKGPLPSLAEVQRAAVDALALTPDSDASGWPSRARWRGLVPRVDLSAGTDDGLDVRSSASTPTDPVTTQGHKLGLDLKARWELGELVFSDMELRANREALARAAAAQLAREHVTKLYFERLEIWLKQRTDGTPALALAAARLDGLIRAATAGRLDRPRKEKQR